MKKSLIVISFVFIFLLSMSIISADAAQNEKISFGEWLKELWGKITGKALDVPLPQNCVDSDGNNLNIQGTVSILNGPISTDSCVSGISTEEIGSKVREYTCLSPTALQATATDYSCQSGYSCQNGACVVSPIITCTDSDGNNPYIKGNVTTPNNPLSIDFCMGNAIIEYTCSSPFSLQANGTTSLCQLGYSCQSGACKLSIAEEPLPPTNCIDSDGDGYNITITNPLCGTFADCNDAVANIYPGAPEICDGKDNDCDVPTSLADEGLPTSFVPNNLNTKNLNDACIDSDVVNEFWCTGGQLQSALKSCSQFVGANSFCNDGACKTCVNTDPPGINYTLAGSAYNLTFLNSPKQDYCINNTHLSESSCSLNAVISQSYNCKLLGATYSCSQGACSCNPNYVKFSCANEVAVFKDAGVCGFPDYSVPYDCDGDGIISTPSCISTSADVAINFIPFNNSVNYTNIGIENVQIAEGYQGVEFDWDFSASEKLDFCQIKIKASSPSDKFGYVLFNSTQNISNKIVYIDRLNSSSNAVCIKDIPGVVSVSEFSISCSASNEVLVKCPSPRDDSGEPSPANSSYNCQIIDNGTTFQVWPLKHSAVKEIFISGLVGTGCFENWNCTDWTNLSSQCGTRTCADLNNCGTILDKPLENKICGGECTPDWICANFGKCVDGIKSRVCTDLNDCATDEGKPGETSECGTNKTKSILFIIFGIIVGLILITLLIWYFMKRGKSEEEFSEPPAHHQQTPPPHHPPQNRVHQYASHLAPQR